MIWKKNTWNAFGVASTLMVLLVLGNHERSTGQQSGIKDKAKSLFDGKTLTGWKVTDFGGQGEVHVKDGAIVMESGNDMTGVTYTRGDFPKMDYEVSLQGKKIKGKDFFCTTTFPVGDSYCSLVVGGWGGTVVGLSTIDFRDASENDTTKYMDFKQDQWYKVRVRVTKNRIQAWINDKSVVDVDTKGKKIGIRAECDLCRPFGLATWRTTGAVKDIQVRLLTEAEKKDGEAKEKKETRKPLPMQGKAVPELEAFDLVMQEFIQEHDIKGGALAVSKDGKMVLSRGYGYSDPHKGTLLGPEIPFRIASISKPITLAGIQKLIREGKLKFEDKAFILLGTQPPPDRKMDKRLLDITIGNLMQHKGGWDREKSGDPMFKSLLIAKALGKTEPATPQDIITYMAGQPLDFEPGSKSVYSNFGYCVLGRVIEKVTGKTYIEYMKQEIFEPLGLKSIDLGRSLPNYRNPAEPKYMDGGIGINIFDPKGKKVPRPDGNFYLEAMDSHGGLIASAPDLVRFFSAYWMNGSPRKDGSASYQFYGSLPGTWAVAIQHSNGVNMAALFTQRSNTRDESYYAIGDMLKKTADEIQQWPN